MTTLGNNIRTARRDAKRTRREEEGRDWLKRTRIDAPPGITQAEAAARAGMKQPQWTLYETGRLTPTIGTLRRVAVALGVTVETLLTEGEER